MSPDRRAALAETGLTPMFADPGYVRTGARDGSPAAIARADPRLFRAVNLWAYLRYPLLVIDHLNEHGRYPDIAFPRSVNEKFLWRKIFDHDPRFTLVSDKLACKDWVRERVPELNIAKVLWVGTNPDEIPDDVLSGNVVVKASHSWNTIIRIHDGQYDRADIAAKAKRWLRRRHGRREQQWAYFNIPPRLFVEEMLGERGENLQELKIYTFGSKIDRVAHIVGRFGKMNKFMWDADADGRIVARAAAKGAADAIVPLPSTADKALEVARRLGREFDHMRIDLLSTDDTLWLGELTVYSRGGRIGLRGGDPYLPAARAWDLSRSAFLRKPPRSGWRAAYARALGHALPSPACCASDG